MNQNLFSNDVFLNMSKEKQEFIINFSKEEMPKKRSMAMPFLLEHIKQAKSQNITFTNEEVRLLVKILSKDLSMEEQEKVDKILTLLHRK